ncbi:hypothetical protein THRCLA_05049 [Thraustotheca clavata]|uniref:N-acetyltransferase domain-containing protein n=1 Tax=Thraustotheca clavata TaxID=74557 RepID=A0A1V9ZX50_9STRA|nr:hypothetical protein THRCLA_05049 [Thraustotheca clavata]
MKIERIIDADEFLSEIQSLVLANPEDMNLIALIAASKVNGNHFWLVRNPDNSVESCALVSERGCVLSPNMRPQAAEAIGEKVGQALNEIIPEARGTEETLPAFLKGYLSHKPNFKAKHHMGVMLYSLQMDQLPSTCNEVAGRFIEGYATPATIHDKDILLSFMKQFTADANVMSTPEQINTSVENHLNRQSLFVWKVNDQIVASAGHSQPLDIGTHTLYRIVAVFTKATARCKGYASALTTALCHHLRSKTNNCRIVLFADTSNPASNKAYQRIGFVQHKLMMSASFEPDIKS